MYKYNDIIPEVGEDEIVGIVEGDDEAVGFIPEAYDEQRECEAYAQLCQAYDDELTFLRAINELIRGE